MDLVDDEDTQLMFDDWNDYTQSKREGTSKLHLFVDWRKESSQSSGEAKQPDLGTIGSVESMDASTQRSSAERMDSAGTTRRPSQLITHNTLVRGSRSSNIQPSL